MGASAVNPLASGGGGLPDYMMSGANPLASGMQDFSGMGAMGSGGAFGLGGDASGFAGTPGMIDASGLGGSMAVDSFPKNPKRHRAGSQTFGTPASMTSALGSSTAQVPDMP